MLALEVKATIPATRRVVCLFLAGLCLDFFAGADAAELLGLGDLRGVWEAHFNHDASRVFLRTRKGEVGLWDADEGTAVVGDLGALTPSESCVMSADGRRFLL